MNIDLQPVDIKDKPVLIKLLTDYQKEILNLDSVGKYKYLDTYWGREDRWPFFILVDGVTAGFVLVNSYNIIEKDAKNIAEFYVKEEFRHKGVGRLAARKIFDLFPGKWEVRELKENLQAVKFWQNVIGEYTKNNFQEFVIDSEKWNGPVQVFNTLKKQ